MEMAIQSQWIYMRVQKYSIPGAGWIGLDTTSGLFTSEGHIPHAATPRPADSAPVTGTTSPCVASIRYETKVMVR